MMARNRKVWGMLGLLLTLVFVVGYGQEPIQPLQKLTVHLTSRQPEQQGFVLHILNMEAHPTRNLQWQLNYTCNCEGVLTAGVAYFYPHPDGGAVVYGKFPSTGTAKLTAWFRKAPPPAPQTGSISSMICSFGPSGSPVNVPCYTVQDFDQCVGYMITRPVNSITEYQANWNFTVKDSAMMLVRVTVQQ